MIARIDLGSKATKGGVWPELIVVSLPCGQLLAGVGHGREQLFVEAFVAQATVEALDERILSWLAWCDVMPFDLVFASPSEDGMAGHFGTIAHSELG